MHTLPSARRVHGSVSHLAVQSEACAATLDMRSMQSQNSGKGPNVAAMQLEKFIGVHKLIWLQHMQAGAAFSFSPVALDQWGVESRLQDKGSGVRLLHFDRREKPTD